MAQSKATLTLKAQIVDVCNSLKAYWPMTLRQIYYQLVAKEIIDNNIQQYKKLSRLLTDLRNDGDLPWSLMEDRTRTFNSNHGWRGKESYTRASARNFLNNYYRHLQIDQTKYIEVWTEKDALSSIFQDVADFYCIPVVVCKGQLSTTFLKDYADRAQRAINNGQEPVIIYGGDLDPSGWFIPLSVKERLAEHHGIHITLNRFALMPEHVDNYDLPHNPDALKWTDGNAKKYVDMFGELAVELDALHPEDLKNEIRAAIMEVMDSDTFDEQQRIEAQEESDLMALRDQIFDLLRDNGIEI